MSLSLPLVKSYNYYSKSNNIFRIIFKIIYKKINQFNTIKINVTPISPMRRLSLRQTLSIPKGLDYFKDHLIKEFSVENLLFWLDVENLKNNLIENKNEFINHIISEYINFNSKYAINLAYTTSCKLIALYEEYILTGADWYKIENQLIECQHEIYKLLSSDSYVRFLESIEYKEFINTFTV